MKTVMAFGTFDFLHPGHVHYLKGAGALGGRLVVVVARDRNVRLMKGKGPMNSEAERLLLVQQLRIADEAVLGDIELRSWGVVKRFHPAVIALGYDQWPVIESLRAELDAAGLHPEIVRISALKPGLNSSSRIKKSLGKK